MTVPQYQDCRREPTRVVVTATSFELAALAPHAQTPRAVGRSSRWMAADQADPTRPARRVHPLRAPGTAKKARRDRRSRRRQAF